MHRDMGMHILGCVGVMCGYPGCMNIQVCGHANMLVHRYAVTWEYMGMWVCRHTGIQG